MSFNIFFTFFITSLKKSADLHIGGMITLFYLFPVCRAFQVISSCFLFWTAQSRPSLRLGFPILPQWVPWGSFLGIEFQPRGGDVLSPPWSRGKSDCEAPTIRQSQGSPRSAEQYKQDSRRGQGQVLCHGLSPSAIITSLGRNCQGNVRGIRTLWYPEGPVGRRWEHNARRMTETISYVRNSEQKVAIWGGGGKKKKKRKWQFGHATFQNSSMHMSVERSPGDLEGSPQA